MIRVVAVGRIRGPLADVADEYRKRSERALRLEVVEVRDEPLDRGTEAEVLSREGARIRAHLDGFVVVALDRGGRQLDSPAFAALVRDLGERAPQRAAFVIGGALGLDRDLLGAARHVVSLGAVTLPHQLARVVLLEQLYRATTILAGHPYHR